MNMKKVSKYIAMAGLIWTVGSMGGCMTQPVSVQTVGELQACYTRMSGSKHSVREYFYCDFKYGENQYQEISYRPSAYMKMKGTDGTRYYIDVPNPNVETWGFRAVLGLVIIIVGAVLGILSHDFRDSEYPTGRGYF